MFKQEQPLECLNLSVNYVTHWTYLQGLREYYQNFMDACVEMHPEFKILHRKIDDAGNINFIQARRQGSKLELIEDNKIIYNKNSKTLTLQNDKAFPVRSLLMGCSVKGPEALGKFGEGMKVSMIALLKSGIHIHIESGDNVYYPTIKNWDHNKAFEGKYDSKVLYVEIKPKARYEEQTKVVIDEIDEEKFGQFLYLSLALLDESTYDKLSFGDSILVIPKDPKLVGKIYKKGVRLELHESTNSQKMQHYAYDFNTIEVGRDRDCVNNVWDLYRLQSQLHFNVCQKFFDTAFFESRPSLRVLLKNHFTHISQFIQRNAYQAYFFHEYSKNNKKVCDQLYDQFLQRYPDKPMMYPVYHTHGKVAADLLHKYGLSEEFYPCVFVSCHEWQNLTNSTKYISAQNKINKEIIEKEIRELSSEENEKIVGMNQKIAILFPEITNYEFKVKLFETILCCKSQIIDSKLIYLKPNAINNQDALIRAICKILLK